MKNISDTLHYISRCTPTFKKCDSRAF